MVTCLHEGKKGLRPLVLLSGEGRRDISFTDSHQALSEKFWHHINKETPPGTVSGGKQNTSLLKSIFSYTPTIGVQRLCVPFFICFVWKEKKTTTAKEIKLVLNHHFTRFPRRFLVSAVVANNISQAPRLHKKRHQQHIVHSKRHVIPATCR